MFGIVLLLVGDRRVGPDVVQRRRQRADIDDVFALLAHLLGELLHLHLAELHRIDQLDVPGAAFLLRPLMGDDRDAGLLGALQHRLGDLHVERHEADHVDLLGDQVLEQLHLLGRIDIGRADHRGVDAEIRAGLLDAVLERVEPGDAGDLDDRRPSSSGPAQRTGRKCRRCRSAAATAAAPSSFKVSRLFMDTSSLRTILVDLSGADLPPGGLRPGRRRAEANALDFSESLDRAARADSS